MSENKERTIVNFRCNKRLWKDFGEWCKRKARIKERYLERMIRTEMAAEETSGKLAKDRSGS